MAERGSEVEWSALEKRTENKNGTVFAHGAVFKCQVLQGILWGG